jgi:hypothetical protein
LLTALAEFPVNLDCPDPRPDLAFEKSKFCDEHLLVNVLSSTLLALAVLSSAACVSPTTADVLPMRTIAKGAFSGIQEPKQEVIQDSAAWERAKTQLTAGVKGGQNMPEVDFTKEMVILVTLGRKNTGGYSIQVTKVESIGDKLRITVARTSPPPGAMAILALTAPFEAVAVPKSGLTPEFVEGKAPEKPKG